VVITASEEFLSPEEVGERLGVSVYTVRRWAKTGQLRAFKPGKEYRIQKSDLEEFLRAREVRPKAPRRSPFEPSLLNGLEEERPSEMFRRSTLESFFRHLTLRTETLRKQAEELQAAGDGPGLWPLFMDTVFLVVAGETIVAEEKENARRAGDESSAERQLRGRVEHRIEDLEEVSKKIGDMWEELLPHASGAAERGETTPSERDNVTALFRRKAG
jgi:excisionase family DNA binding protein